MDKEYLQQLYDYLGQNDSAFQGNVDFDTFTTDMSDEQYAAQIYNYLGGLDETFKMNVDVNTFFEDIGITKVEEVKKKDTPQQGGVSPSGVGSSESVEIQEFNADFLQNYNPDQIVGRDTRLDGYMDPVRSLGMYPEGGQEAVQRAMNQRLADITFTSQQIEAEQPELTRVQAQEQAALQTNLADETEARDEVINSQEFVVAMQELDKDKINLDEDEAIPYFNDTYAKYGFTFRPTGLGDAMVVTTVLANGEVVEETIDLDPFFDATATEESTKLKEFISKYAKKPSEAREEVESNISQASLKAQNLRKTPRLNADGTESTVMFESAVIDGKNVVYPTLFPTNPNVQTTNPDYWTELDGMEAYEEAVKRDEVFIFDTEEEANKFAEGSWKDYRNVDAEGTSFFRERGYDYLTIRDQFDEYERARDAAFFIEDKLDRGIGQELKNLTPEEQQKYGYLYNEKGILRQDAADILKREQKIVDDLVDIYTDDDLQEVREDFDVYIDKQFQELNNEAVATNYSTKVIQNELEANSYAEFGVGIEALYNYVPDDAEGVKLREALLTSHQASKDVAQLAADKFEVAQTYLSGKFDEELRGEIVENYAGMQQQITEGLNRGKAGNEILKLALGLEDTEDEETVAQISRRIVEYMEASNTGQVSRAMSRWHSAKGFREAWDAFSDNPAELAISFAANSISQMLPYGTKIIGISTASGAGTGAVIGSTGFVSGPGGVLTTGGGALAGGMWGLRTGFAATSYALEYTNAIMDAAKSNGYDITNPKDMEAALTDENVWSEGGDRGRKRGIPIAIVDMLSSGLAGRVFKVGKTASRSTRFATQVGERLVFDPLAEATGEFAAQVNVGDDIEFKEIFAEALGGIGNNAPFAALNMAMDLRQTNNTNIANDLTTIQGLNKELGGGIFKPSPTRVSNWANNMEKLGQISKETNQRIQLNLGLRQDAINVLEATEGKGGVDTDVLNRTMELMSAKQELESTPNRKQVFAGKIKEINAELAELAETKKVRPKAETATEAQIQQGNTFAQGFQTNVAGIGLVEQTSDTDIRETAQSKYTIDGKSLTRRKFLNRINDMSLAKLKGANITVDNDQEVTDILTEKFGTDAIQEQETGGLSPNQRTGGVQTLEEAVRTVQQEQTTEPETTEETEVERLNDSQIPVSQQKFTVEMPDGDVVGATITTQLDGSRKLKIGNDRVQNISKDNTLSNEEYLTEAAGEIQTTEDVDITTVRNPKMDERMSNRQRKAAGLPVKEQVSVETETEAIVVPKSVVRPTKKDVAAFDNQTIEETRLDGILAGIADKQIADKPLTKFQSRVAEQNQSRIDEIVSSKTLKEEAADLEQTLDKKGGRIDFRLKEELSTEGRGQVDEIAAAMSANADGAVIELDEVKETMPESPKIDIEELNSRVDNPIPTVEWKVIDGVPVIFNISDQLRTGDIVNPLTGTTIDNLKGGIGFNGIEGHQNIAWASVNEAKVKAQQTAATEVYQNNKEFFDNWWGQNPEYNGLVPMVIVKMESSSILSNEAVVRVLADNLKSFPQENKVAALEAFNERILSQREKQLKIVETGKLQNGNNATPSTIKQAEQKVAQIDDVISMMEAINATSIDQILTPQALENLKGITSVNIITQNIAYGKPNSPAAKKVTPGIPSTPVAKALLGEKPTLEERSKLNLGVITDLITEPQLEKTPTRSAFMITGIDVLNPEIETTTHPNYPVGPKGKVIGIVEQPQSVLELFPAAYNNIALAIEQEARGETRQRSAKQRLMEKIPVQMGMTNTEFIASKVGIDNVGRFMDFLNRSMPFVNISTDSATFNRVISSPFVTPYLKEGQVAYGMTQDGKIFINSDVHNSESELFNTAIHEMGHIWTETLKLTPKGKKLYARGKALAMQTETYQKFLKKFNGDVDKAVDETLATLIGNKGQSVVDASLKQKLKDWITAVWSYVKDTFKLSKDLTVEEIQDLTMDEFLGVALADILQGKPIKMTDKQMSTLTENMADAMFRVDDSVAEIVRIGRENGYSDASIREVLRGRGVRAAEINEAMTYQVDLFNEIPREFRRIEGEGGILRAAKLFNEVNVALQKFATSGRANIIGRRRVKSFAEIRQKAQELLEANPIYQEQNEQVQMELKLGLDRSLGYRSNRTVSQDMAAIRQALRERKIGRENLRDAQIVLKNFIRANLPKSKTYTQAQINRLIKAVTETNADNFRAQAEKVMKVVDQERGKIKKQVLKDIYKEVKAKARPRKQSGKPRPKGIDAVGQVIFSNIKTVMDAVLVTNPELRAQKLKDIKDKLDANRAEIDAASAKILNDEDLTLREESLLQLQLAYDQFSNLDNATLEEAQALLEDVKQQKSESILRFNNRRLKQAADKAALTEEVTNQIQETNPDLFEEDGTVKNINEINDDRDNLAKDFTAKGILKKVYLKIVTDLFGRDKDGLLTRMKNTITHLGTIANFLDRSNKGLNVFRDKVYRKLNRMEEVALQNMRVMRKKINDIAAASGIEGGIEGVELAVNKALGVNKVGVPNTMTFTVRNAKTDKPRKSVFNANQLLRIYALSKNPIQRAKLERQGFTDQNIEDIKTALGPELIDFADRMVNYLSTESFNEVNAVYKQVNGVNLGFIENYFPTKTVRSEVDAQLLSEGDFNGIFSAETAPAFKDRVDTVSEIDLKGGTFTGTLMNHMETMERYKALAPGVQELNAFFQIPAVDSLLRASGLLKLTKTLVNVSVNPQSAFKADKLNAPGLMERFQSKFTSFALAFKVIQIAKQATSFINAFEQYNYFPKDSKFPKALQGPIDFAMFMVDGAGVMFEMAKDLVGKEGAIAKARKMSATFDARVEQGLEGDVYGLESGSQTFKPAGKGVGRFATARRNFKRLAARPTIIGDIMGVMGYYINYKRNIANGMSEAQALEEFNDYNATQQTRRNTEKIPLQLQGDFLSKGFTMFGSTLFLQINKVMQSATNMGRAFSTAIGHFAKGEFKKGMEARPTKKDLRAFYLNYAVANVLFVGMSNIALLTRGDKEDRDAFMRKLKDAMLGLNLLYQLPYLGAAAEEGVNWIRGTRKPVDDVVNPVSAVLGKMYRNYKENPDDWFKAIAIPTIELALGAQVDPFIGLHNAIKDGVFGDTTQDEFYDNIYDFLGITKSYRPGYGRKGSSVKGIMPIGGIKNKSDLKRYDPDLYEQVYGEADRIMKEQRELRKKMLEEMGYKEVGGKLYPID